MDNADALIDPYLFGSADAFKYARFPEAHTFLVKWPLFWLISALGYRSWAYIGVTVAVCLLTVGGIAYTLWRIERRRPTISALFLLLAASLMLVPPEPYIGALLPVDMAMLASRNLEFMMLIGAVFLVAGTSSVRNWRFYLAWGILVLLFASDGLFPLTAAGGGVLFLFYTWLRKHHEAMRYASRWLVVVIAAIVTAKLLIHGIRLSGVTQIIAAGSLGGPYGLAFDPKNIALGIFFSATGTLTVLGANPLYDFRALFHLPATTIERFTQPVMIAYVAFIAAFVVVLIALARARRKVSAKPTKPSRALIAFGILAATGMVVVGAVIFTNHYYAADSRYLSLLPFVIFIGVALYARNSNDASKLWPMVAALSLIAICFAIPNVASHRVNYDKLTHNISVRNQYIIDAMHNNPVDVLVGDYCRILPIKSHSPALSIMPMDSCTHPRDILTTDAWKHDLDQTSFAYLLTTESLSPASPGCSYESVVKKYGLPNSSIIIAGTQQNPIEMLLLYEKGEDSHIAAPVESKVALPFPKSINEIVQKNKSCGGRTTVSVVAHQDDDLLFMNPTLMNTPDAATTACIRTVYVTAGDAGNIGRRAPYWMGRERGSQAAYATMFGFQNSWTSEPFDIGNGLIATYASPRDPLFKDRVSLIFLRLPDGNINGRGFGQSHAQSLAKMAKDPHFGVKTVDGGATYNRQSLMESLARLFTIFKPDDVNTQATDSMSTPHDHSDHIEVGRLVSDALVLYSQRYAQESTSQFKKPDLHYYRGYPIQRLSQNIFGADLRRKEQIFMEYAQYDGSVCQTLAACYSPKIVYGRYLQREYRQQGP